MKKLLTLILSSAILSACGGGGGGSGTVPEARPSGALNGYAVDGPIRNGTVRVLAIGDGGKPTETLATATTDDSGRYAIDLTARTQIVLIEVEGGSYVEESTGQRVSLGLEEKLTSVVQYTSGDTIDAMITPFTHMAYGLFLYQVNQRNSSLEEGLREAYAAINADIGLDVLRTIPTDVTNDDALGTALNDSLEYGYRLAAFSQLSENEAARQGIPAHSNNARTRSYDIVDAIARDLAYDGEVNGIGYARLTGEVITEIRFGDTQTGEPLYTRDLAIAFVEFVNSDNNALGFTAEELVTIAVGIDEGFSFPIATDTPSTDQPTPVTPTPSDDQNDTPSTPSEPTTGGDAPQEPDNSSGGSFDLEGPSLTITSASRLDGTVTLQAAAQDPVGVSSVEFFLDGESIGTSSGTSPSIVLNTEEYEDGPHTLRVDASDSLNNASSVSQDVFFLPPAGMLSGVAHDAPIIDGTVTAYNFNGGERQESIGTTTTDSSGDYSLDLVSLDGLVQLEVTGGYYVEEASSTNVRLQGDQNLRGLTFYERGREIEMQLTPYTHWATCLAEYLIEEGDLTVGNAINQANEIFSNIAGVPITAVKPTDITREENFSAFLTPELEYGYVTAAISGLTRVLAEENDVTPHSQTQYTSIYFADVVCSDIRHDGLMDGIAEPTPGNPSGQLFIGRSALSPDYYRTVVAQQILEIAADENVNAAGISANDLLQVANRYSLNGSAIFGDFPARQVDTEGPVIATNVAENTFFANTATIPFTAIDPIGVLDVTFYVGENLIGSGDLSNLQANINTLNYADGEHTLTVVARDLLMNESRFEIPLMFINTAAEISVTSSALVNSSSYTAAGSYLSSGAPITGITVNGVSTVIDELAGTWEAEIELSEGFNDVRAEITDIAGNVGTQTLQVGFDNVTPSLRFIAQQATRKVNITDSCSPHPFDEGINTSPLCLNEANFSLNGTPVTSTLSQSGYLLLRVSASDDSSSGVFTDPHNLVVEYEYTFNNSATGWMAASPVNGSPGDFIVPITSEFLTGNFFESSRDEIHRIEFRATDAAGNARSGFISEFFLNVIPPELEIEEPTVTNESIFATSFSNRSNLNGAIVLVDRVVRNNSAMPVWISVTPQSDHTLDHAWQTAVRENRVREVQTRQWRGSFARLQIGSPCGNPLVCGSRPYSFERLGLREVDAIAKRSTTSGVFEIQRPLPIYGDYLAVSTDNPVPQAESGWNDFSLGGSNYLWQGGDEAIRVDYALVDPQHGAPFNFLDDGDPSTMFGGDADSLGYSAGLVQNGTSTIVRIVAEIERSSQNFATEYWGDDLVPSTGRQFQQYVSYSFEREPGYPRNIISSFAESYTFSSLSSQVLINNSEATERDGYYLIPAMSEAVIRAEIELPEISNHLDSRVAANDNSVPYEAISLDSSLSWLINTGVTIESRVASRTGNITDDNDVITQTETDSIGQSYSIER